MTTGKKQYIGDGVYASTEDGCLSLTTESGIHITNQIYLEGFVIENLNSFLASLKQEKVDG